MPPVPPKRKVWDQARAAETAWSKALASHVTAAPGTPGLASRLQATAAAAREMAAVARSAQKAGLEWATLPDDDRELDVLGGELAAPHRWLCAEWVAVESAERQAALTARTGNLDGLAGAFEGLAAAFDALSKVADRPHGPPVGTDSRPR